MMMLEERDLLSTNSDVELQYSKAAGPGVAFPRPVVTTGISAGSDTREPRHENERVEGMSEKGQGGEVGKWRNTKREIGVTTTVEQYYK